MKRILALLLVIGIIAVLPSYGKKHQTEEIITTMTQLQKRQFQTRTYKSTDKVIVMKGILNTLQDEGYIVYNVNSLLGFIYGVKDFDTTDPNVDISKEFGLTKSRLNYNGVTVATLEVTINVTDYGEDLKVRTNFKRKLLNQYGNAQFIDDIDEEEFYTEFYEKADKAIQLQKQTKAKIQPVRREIIPVPVPVKPRLEVKKETPIAVPQEVSQDAGNKLKPVVDESTVKRTELKEIKIKEETPATTKEDIKKVVEQQTEQEELSEKEQAKKEAREEKERIKKEREQAKIEAKLLKEQEKEAKRAAKELMKEE
jgi:hypothetical protein